MNLPNSIEIHEFNTGINPERTADGGWISRGFTGRYINITLDNIPDVVERSIANWEFAVTEGSSTEKPAIIGRVVGAEDNMWSVMAVVTRGRDEIGRSLSVYRYFLCQGANNLWKILGWWESQGMPTFDPFDTKSIGQPNLYTPSRTSASEPPPEILALVSNASEPTLLSHEQQYDLATINILAMRKAKNNGQPISWAYNVQALEKPERFQIIHTASERAYQILQRVLANTTKVLAPVVADEAALKSSIRGLMNSSQVKPENVKVIADALANDKITSAYWHTLFDGQGAKTAIAQKIYSPQMVRLITLRAVVIPDTMLEFLSWLNIKPGQKPDDNQTVSLEFQKAIRSALPKDKLANSIKCILPELLNESSKITPEAIAWLLRSDDSVWASGRKDFIKYVEYDLQLIVDSLKGKTVIPSNLYKCGSQTWARLESYKQEIYSGDSSYKLGEYTGFAKLFENVKDYSLSAYFYQVSQGIVPKDVFNEVQGSKEVFKLRLRRKQNLLEKSIEFLSEGQTVSPHHALFTLFIVLFFSIVYSWLIKSLFVRSNTSPAQPNQTTNISRQREPEKQINSGNSGGKNNNPQPKIRQKEPIYDETTIINQRDKDIKDKDDKIQDAIQQQQFNQTINAIEKIISEVTTEFPSISNRDIVLDHISIKLGDTNFKEIYDNARKNPASNDRRKVAEIIYEYQTLNESESKDAFGYFTVQQSSYKRLKREVESMY